MPIIWPNSELHFVWENEQLLLERMIVELASLAERQLSV